jgi:hypothetical protein
VVAIRLAVEPIGLHDDRVAAAAHARPHRLVERETDARDGDAVGGMCALDLHGAHGVPRIGLEPVGEPARGDLAELDDVGARIRLAGHVGHRR